MANILLRRADCLGIRASLLSNFRYGLLVSFIFFMALCKLVLLQIALLQLTGWYGKGRRKFLITFREKFSSIFVRHLLWLRKKGTKPPKVLGFHNCVDDYYSIIASFRARWKCKLIFLLFSTKWQQIISWSSVVLTKGHPIKLHEEIKVNVS